MSATHKAALAEGRDQGRAVRHYLEALEAHRPKRGRRRTADSIKKRLATIAEKLPSADPLGRLHLHQEQMNLENELATMEQKVDLSGLEKAFIKAAAPYGERKGISYGAWRSAGVDPAVLRQAGITRASQ